MTDYHPRKWSDWDLQPVPHPQITENDRSRSSECACRSMKLTSGPKCHLRANTEDLKLQIARDKQRQNYSTEKSIYLIKKSWLIRPISVKSPTSLRTVATLSKNSTKKVLQQREN